MTVDALLLLSFGGPEQPDDVLPFLRTVTKGRNVGDDRLTVVAEQYHRFGGRSPINDQCRALIAAVEADFAAEGVDLPVYWGNRNWHPFVSDTVATMAADGIEHALVFVTSAFGSYSGCRQYNEDLARAADAVGPGAPRLDKLRLFYNHPGFIEPMAERLASAMAGLGELDPAGVQVVFTAHSIPESMAAGCDYEAQLEEAATLVLDAARPLTATPLRSALRRDEPTVVYQSRSGPPTVPWLGPDINDHLRVVTARHVVVVPIGFVSDHMEVIFDLDTQVAETAASADLGFTRVPTVGTDQRFITMIRQLVAERTSGGARLSLGSLGPWPDACPADHCPAPARPPTPARGAPIG